jgi:hypothetical protein
LEEAISDASDHNLGRADKRSRGISKAPNPGSSFPFVRPARAGPGSLEPSRGASRPCGFDPSRESTSCPLGQKRKTGPLCSSHLHKGPALSCLCRDTERLQRTFQILWKVSLCVRVATRRRQSSSRGCDYFFFLEVFFATFLVAALAVFFAFFAFLAMSSSVKKFGSVNLLMPCIDMHNIDDITKEKLIPTSRQVGFESLAGGTRSRAPPSLHAGVAITVPRSGAFLAGLATAVGPASHRVPRRRYADAPAAASYCCLRLAPALFGV